MFGSKKLPAYCTAALLTLGLNASAQEPEQYRVTSEIVTTCSAAFTAAAELVDEQDKPGYSQNAFLYAVASAAMLGIHPDELQQNQTYSDAYFAFFEGYDDEEQRPKMLAMVKDCFKYHSRVNELIKQATKALQQP